MPPETPEEPKVNNPESAANTSSKQSPQPVDPNSAQKTALIKAYKFFKDEFYGQTTLREQAVIVNALLSVLMDITKKEEQEAAAVVRTSSLNEEPEETAPKPKSIVALKTALRAFRRDLVKSTKLVQKVQALTKGGFLAGEQARKKLTQFAVKVQEDNVSLNKELDLLLAPAPEKTPAPITEIEGAEEYKKKIQGIEKVHDTITGTDTNLGGIDGIVALLVDSNQMEPQWPEIKKAVISALKLLMTIKKWFPSLLPFEKGQVENEKLLEAYEQAIEKFNVDASDIQTLEDALEGEASIMFLKRFQQRLVEFSMDIENIFGVEGLRSDDVTKDIAPGEEEPEDEEPTSPVLSDQKKQLARRLATRKYEGSEFLKGLPSDQKEAVISFLTYLTALRVISESVNMVIKNKDFLAAYKELEEKEKELVNFALRNKEAAKAFLDMILGTLDDEEDKEDEEGKEVIKFSSSTDIVKFFNYKLFKDPIIRGKLESLNMDDKDFSNFKKVLAYLLSSKAKFLNESLKDMSLVSGAISDNSSKVITVMFSKDKPLYKWFGSWIKDDTAKKKLLFLSIGKHLKKKNYNLNLDGLTIQKLQKLNLSAAPTDIPPKEEETIKKTVEKVKDRLKDQYSDQNELMANVEQDVISVIQNPKNSELFSWSSKNPDQLGGFLGDIVSGALEYDNPVKPKKPSKKPSGSSSLSYQDVLDPQRQGIAERLTERKLTRALKPFIKQQLRGK